MSRSSPRGVRLGTWAEFLEHAEQCGVEVRNGTTVEGDGITPSRRVQYLFREVSGEPRWHIMPENWSPERYLGLVRIATMCRHLRIPEPPHWPIRF